LPIFQLLYASGGSGPVTNADIRDILTTSRRNNAALGVTGLLLFADNMFIQVLEGEQQRVSSLADTIRRDPRHRNYMELLTREAPRRAFAQWQMGFKRLTPGIEEDDAVFRATKNAVAGRIGMGDGGLMMDAVLAFANRDFLADA
jgi:hypothetical protein